MHVTLGGCGAGSQTAKWWDTAFHNVTAMVGAGVLGLPYAMTYLGKHRSAKVFNL